MKNVIYLLNYCMDKNTTQWKLQWQGAMPYGVYVQSALLQNAFLPLGVLAGLSPAAGAGADGAEEGIQEGMKTAAFTLSVEKPEARSSLVSPPCVVAAGSCWVVSQELGGVGVASVVVVEGCSVPLLIVQTRGPSNSNMRAFCSCPRVQYSPQCDPPQQRRWRPHRKPNGSTLTVVPLVLTLYPKKNIS